MVAGCGEGVRVLGAVIVRQNHSVVLPKLAGGVQQQCLIIKRRCPCELAPPSAWGKEPTFGVCGCE